ncbi:NACHT domain-containing protein [Psychrobacter proteolyticus]|uniref:NACHT domain-containing protein n=1 Tax=Psychrobacter proteolyticus TaxID=147825 RepID=UPI003D03AEC8
MSEIILKKPVSVLNRNVKFDIKDFFIQASKTAVQATAQGVTGNLIGSAATIVKGVFDISKTTELELKVEELAWLLIARSLTQAITEMLTSDQDLFGSNVDEVAIARVATKIEDKINESEIAIDNDFFEAPHHLVLLYDLEIALIEWFQQLGLDEAKSKSTYERLKGQFSFSLDKEWVTNASQYTSIIDQLNTPFTKATVKQRNIRQYRSWLQQQVNDRMFDEAFGLKQIYVPLRAYYVKSEEQDEKIIEQDLIEPLGIKTHKNVNKIVCDLESEIQEWLKEYNEHDTLRVISGGPGSGKSSFAKILAANLSAQSNIPILFVPLHHFYLSDYLLEAIKKFVDNQLILSHTNMTEEQDLLLIFDGLDELSMQSGTNAAEVSNRFIAEVQDALRDRKNVHWKAIITGRELSIQSQQHRLKKPKTIYYLLPYYIDEENRESFNDSNNLLMTDQRSEWWQKLSKLKGLEFEDLPKELATKHLEPITTEPLLNYLVSLSYLKEDGIVFSEHTNLNEIYADLLDSVHERKYTDSGTHRSVDSIDKRKFIRILQEIALTVWHENGRTASVSQITEQCKRANIDSYFKEFTKDAESGVIRLLMAFYFRKFDGNNSDETFEFTHKSFGEYLAAKRIMLELSKMLNEVERFKEEVDSGWTLEVAFEKWISVCGPQRIDNYLRNFLAGEIQILASSEYGLSRISKYQELLIELIQMAVNSKSPIKKLSLSTFEV